ncbi:MAG: hypothetical protein ABI856_09175 [Nitrospira sp.]
MRGADYYDQRLLGDLGMAVSGFLSFPKCANKQQAREPLLTGIEELAYAMLFDAHVV